jgi:hypothetical protein
VLVKKLTRIFGSRSIEEMLTPEENDLLCRVEAKAPMGN